MTYVLHYALGALLVWLSWNWLEDKAIDIYCKAFELANT